MCIKHWFKKKKTLTRDIESTTNVQNVIKIQMEKLRFEKNGSEEEIMLLNSFNNTTWCMTEH